MSLPNESGTLATREWVSDQGYITSYTNYYLTSGSLNGMTYTFTSNGGNPSVSFTLPSVIELQSSTTEPLQITFENDRFIILSFH